MVNLTLETLFHQKAKEKRTTYSNAAEQVMHNRTSNVWQFISPTNEIRIYHE